MQHRQRQTTHNPMTITRVFEGKSRHVPPGLGHNNYHYEEVPRCERTAISSYQHFAEAMPTQMLLFAVIFRSFR